MLGVHVHISAKGVRPDTDITVTVIPDEIDVPLMRGDLHTLKNVCRYASVVMLVGEIAFLVLIAATLVLGAMSFGSAEMREFFIGLVRCGGSNLSLIAATMEMALIFVAMFVTVKAIHDIMVSIQNEHSPFLVANADRFKTVCLAYLILSVPLTLLEYLNRDDAVMAVIVLLVCLLISVCLYCLTIVFRYGSMLQTESDQTL